MRLILLIVLSILRETQGDSTRNAATQIPTKAIKSKAFFNYKYCDKGSDGLSWACFIPNKCIDKKSPRKDLVFNDNVETIGNCPALLAIQTHSTGPQRFRIVMQIHNEGVPTEDQVKDDELRFFIGNNIQFDCQIDATQGVIAKTQVAANKHFDILKDSKIGRREKDTFMCGFIADLSDAAKLFPDNDKVGMEWNKKSGNSESQYILGAGLMSTLGQTKHCDLSLMNFQPSDKPADYVAERLLMETAVMKCSEGYQLRMRDRGQESYETYERVECIIATNELRFFDENNVDANKRVKMEVHCARKKCKQCVEPKCPNPDTTKCTTIAKGGKADNWEECTQLKCPSGRFKLASKISTGQPTCDGGDVKWKLDGAEVDSVECGDEIKCALTAMEAVKVKEGDKDITFKEDNSEVTCKQGNMSYTSGDKTIMLSKVSCNVTNGQWYEARVDPEGAEPYNNGTLECKAAGGMIVAPAKGYLLPMGVAIAVLALVAAAIFLIFCCCKRKKAKGEASGQKHKLATKSSKSKESKSKESKSKPPSSSGATGVPSSDQSVTQKNSKKEREKVSLGIDKSEPLATGISIDKSAAKTGAEIKDEERSNPTERSAIPKTDDLKAAAPAGKKKTAMQTAAFLESSKMEQDGDDQEDEATPGAPTKVATAMAKRGNRTRNLDGTQQTTMGPDGTQNQTTVGPDGTQNQTTMGADGTQVQTMQKRRATRKGTFMETAHGGDPTRGPDGTQQPSENGPDESGTQIPTNATNDTQAATVAGRTRVQRGRRTQPTQQGGADEDDEQETPMWQKEVATAVENTDELNAASGTAPPKKPRTRDATATRTKMMTAAGVDDESAAMDPQPELKTGKEKREDDEDTQNLATGVGKVSRHTVDKHTAKEKEDDETAKKVKSKKQRATLKPREIELNEKEKKIKAGAKRNRNDYPTMKDIESDWDSDKDKRDKPKDEKARKKTLEDKKKKKSKKQEEAKKESNKKADEKMETKKNDGKKEEKKKDRKKDPTALFEMTAVDDGPSGNYRTGREETARDGTQYLTPYDPTQNVTTRPDTTQRTRHKTKTVFTTAFDPTETHAAPTIADPTQAVTAQDFTQAATMMDPTQGGQTTIMDRTQGGGRTSRTNRTQAATMMDPTQGGQTTIMDRTQGGGRTTRTNRTQGGYTTMADPTQGGRTTIMDPTQGGLTTIADGTQGATTVADFTQVAGYTGADPTQAGTTAYDPTQAQTTAADVTQGDTRTRLFTGRTRTASRNRRPRTRSRTRADFTQAGTTVADYTQGGITTVADQAPDPTQAVTPNDPTLAPTMPEGSFEGRLNSIDEALTQNISRDRTVNDPTQLRSAETQADGRTRRTRSKSPLTGRTATRLGSTQTRTRADFTQQDPTRTRADFTQDPTRLADGTQGATTHADQTQAHTAQDPTQAATTVGDGTQMGTKTRTRTRPGGTQTATAGDHTQAETRTRANPTQTETRGDETQGQTDAHEVTQGTQVPSKTKTRKTTGKDFTQTATAGSRTQTMTAVDPTGLTTAKDPTQTQTRGSRTQTQTAVDPTGLTTAKDRTQTQTAVDPTHTMTAVDPTRTMTAVDPTRTETNDRRSRTPARTQTMTAVDPTGLTTAKDRTQTATRGSRTQTMTALDPTGLTTAKDRTQTQTAVDPTHTMTAVDPTRTMTAVDRTRTGTNEHRRSRTPGRTQTMTAVDPTGLTTAKDRTQTATRGSRTQTQTAVDPTHTMTAVDPTHMTTAKDGTQTATVGEPTQTGTRGSRTQTMTAVDRTGTMTAVDPTGFTTAKDPTQTQTNAEQTQTNLERTKTAKDRTQTQTHADETQGHGATTLGQEKTQAMTKQSTAKDRTQTATKGERTQTATRDKTREGRTQHPTTAARTQTTAKEKETQMTGHETTQGPTSKDPTQTHNDQ